MDYQAPWVPGGTELVGKWHSQTMPASRSMGKMKVRYPPRYLRNDRRHPKREFIVKAQGPGLELEDQQKSPEPARSRVTDDP